MKKREEIIKLWFDMWLKKKDLGISEIFSEDIVYIESWGPRYEGIYYLKYWFSDWNKRGSVIEWKIKDVFHKEEKTVVEWFFKCFVDGKEHFFDGVSLIKWTEHDKIQFLQEFACNLYWYNPYEEESK